MPRVRRFWLLLPLTASLAAAATVGENLLANPGFESSSNGTPSAWVQPDYWPGTIAVTDENPREGKQAGVLTAEVRDGRSWAKTHSPQIAAVPGLRYRYSFWARGSGELEIAVVNYRRDAGDLAPYEYIRQPQRTTLTDAWQELTLEFSPLDRFVQRFAATVEVHGDHARAVIDGGSFGVLQEREGRLLLDSPYAMTKVGEAATVTVRATADGRPLTGEALLLAGPDGETRELPLSAEGVATVTVPATAEPGLQTYQILSPELGQSSTLNVDTVEPATYAAFEQAAGAATVADAAHLLFLGDSLTDQQRGRNFVDMVTFWLRQSRPNLTSRNAGVGGDYIRRTWERLNQEPKSYRLEMFDNLYQPKPDRIFIFLGHNDSKLTSSSEFQKAVVPPDEFRDLYAKTLAKLKADSGAPLTVLSSTSSVYEICQERADKLVAAGKAASLFGKPEVLEEFNAIAREVAQQAGADWLDVYEPTRTHPDKPSLFTADGVHITLAGSHLIALEILRSLAN